MKIGIRIAAICLAVITLFCTVAYAIEIVPYADSEFITTSASLTTRKSVTFSCSTFQKKSSISITACWLEQKTNNVWNKVCDLEAPSTVSHDMASYVAVMDYSSQIGTGTFRVGFTVDADGHAISRYSNERTF